MVTGGALPVALARLTLAPIDGVAKETLRTLLTVIPSGVVETCTTDRFFFILAFASITDALWAPPWR